ncbi:ROK family protein [Cohnella sp. JJ-181]|uniref:ROK family protein n=1 Tax=Cohnella rhizoplanae TaxID=2974897 RepID=UPI0022FF9A64|nr:ROK family protein [Cohnella sp. JJ-181]CAI6061462.1 N-acetyl-D-glucosamine kinase [Cohnella sp. JJ-181]
MSKSVVIALDVGGTQIKAGAVVDGKVAESSVGHYESRADLAAGAMIGHFAAIFADILSKSGADAGVDGLGIAFPGPFDYEAGVSRIRGLGKFDALYGLPIGSMLAEALRSDERTSSRLAPHFRIAFENDAALFGLGEAGPGGAAEGAERVVCLTIGTGLGSCFLDSGRLVKTRADVPSEGWLYATPYQDGMADDYVSRRGVLQLAPQFGYEAAKWDVRELASLADGGDDAAQRLFHRFGERMAEILTPPLLRFRPDAIVLGGQISKSAHLFAPAFRHALADAGTRAEVRVSRDTLTGTLLGIYRFMTGTTFLNGGER